MVTYPGEPVARDDGTPFPPSLSYTDTIEHLLGAIREQPHDFRLRQLASEAYERMGALPEAAEHLLAVLAEQPNHLDANRRLARLLYELGDTGGAIRCWHRLVAATDEDVDAQTLLAVALCTDGQYEWAVDLFTKLADKQPLDAAALANLGMALLAAGREDDALQALQRAAALDPRSASAQCGLGLAHYKHARWQEAAVAFRATERCAPDSAIGSFNLGLALDRLGDRDEARRALLRAAAIEPHDEDVQRALDPLLMRHSVPGVPSAPEVGAAIRGDLRSFDLLNVLEFLRMQEKTGSLVISAAAGVGMLRLERGMLIGGSAPGLARLGDLLLRRGLVSREQLQLALSRQRELNPGAQEPDANTLAEVLLRERLLDEKQLSKVLFQMILDVIGQINRWREGLFAFHAAADSAFPIQFNVQAVVLDLLRLEDERRQRTEPT